MKTSIFSLVCFFIFHSAYSQNVGINNDGSAPDPSAILDLKSTNKALILTRVNKSNVPNPKEGMLIYDTVDDILYYYNGSAWVKMSQSILQDVDADTKVDVEESPDNDEIIFRANNLDLFSMEKNSLSASVLNSFDSNVLIGKNAANDLTRNKESVGIGNEVLFETSTSKEGVYIGTRAGAFLGPNSDGNVFVGYWAGRGATTTSQPHSDKNVGIGYTSMIDVDGFNNIGIGSAAGGYMQGYENVTIGNNAGNNIVGNYNIAIGEGSAKGVTGNKNIAIGNDLLLNQTATGQLVIEAYGGETPLISGDFNNDSLNVHNILSVGSGIGSKLYIGNDFITDGGIDILRAEANFTPTIDNGYNLGGSSFKWKNLFMQGNLNIGTAQLKEDGTDILRTDSHFTPLSNGIRDLGDASHQWKNVNLNGMIKFNSVDFGEDGTGVLRTSGDFSPTSNGLRDLGDATHAWKDITLKGQVNIESSILSSNGPTLHTNSSFTPLVTNTQNLGNPALYWNNIYLSGEVRINSSKIKEIASEVLQFNSSIEPTSNFSSKSLGATAKRWKNIHLHDTIFLNQVELTGNSTFNVNKSIHPVSNGTLNLGASTKRWSTVYAVNGTINTSDLRAKKNISTLPYGLNSLMKIRTFQYNWNEEADTDKKHLGVIAQELLEIVPEVVNVPEEKDALLGVKYAELIPVLIKSIQEQQKQIEQLQKRVKALEK